jgi:hypothetical protein
VHNVKGKTFEVNQKKGSLGKKTTTHLHLALHKISGTLDANQK